VRAPGRRFVMAVLVVVLLGGACGEGADEAQIEAALAGSEPVTFANDLGDELAGRLFGPEDASAGVVLAHGLPEDQSDWWVFADRLGAEGYRVLTFDFRGYCPGGDAGCSEGEKDPATAPADLGAAVAEVRSQGVRRVAAIGSSMGGTAGLVTAAAQGDALAVLITVSSPASIGGLVAGPDVLERVTAAKLFLAGAGDTTAATAAQDFFNRSLQPKRVELLTTDDHGTAMLRGNQGEQTRTLMLSYLGQHLPAQGAG
jgi:pimeloyl-ACP methyl ester carboxylesterase